MRRFIWRLPPGEVFNRWIEIDLFNLNGSGGWSAIISPSGEMVAGPLVNGEGMVIGEVDLEGANPNYPIHDRVGYPSRPDVFRLLINREACSVPLSQHHPVEEA